MSVDWTSLGAEMRTAWRRKLDGARGVELAADVGTCVEQADDLAGCLPAVVGACECLWDCDRADQALELLDALDRRSEELGQRGHQTLVTIATSRARSYHRLGQAREALAMAVEALRLIIDDLGGRAAYRERLREPVDPDDGGVCSVLGIAIPAAREAVRQGIAGAPAQLDALLLDALTLTLRGHRRPLAEGGHALVCQLLYALLARDVEADLPAVHRLVGWEALLRPTDARGQVTRRVVDMALARWRGDLAGEAQIAQMLAHDLVEASLDRHLRMLTDRGHWPDGQSADRGGV